MPAEVGACRIDSGALGTGGEGRAVLRDAGLPCLKDALASLACVVDAQMVYASHTLFVGRVEAIRMAGASEPLVWHDGHGALPYPLGVNPAEMLRRAGHACIGLAFVEAE